MRSSLLPTALCWARVPRRPGGIVTLNKVSSGAEASISYSDTYTGARVVSAGGGVKVSATDSAAINASTTLAASSTASNPNPFASGDAVGVAGAISLNDVHGRPTATIDTAI